jgi:hypothetical protein
MGGISQPSILGFALVTLGSCGERPHDGAKCQSDHTCEVGAGGEGYQGGRAGNSSSAGEAAAARPGGEGGDGGAAPRGGEGRDGGAGGAVPQMCDPNNDEMLVLDSLEPNKDCPAEDAIAWNVARGGLAAASEPDLPGSTVGRLFDGNSGTSWRSKNPTPWIAYELPGQSAHLVTAYRLTSAGTVVDAKLAGDPNSWQLQGSNDPRCSDMLNWITLDTQIDQAFESRHEAKIYEFDNATAYHRYRLLVTANDGASAFQIAELELLGEGSPLVSVDDAEVGSGANQWVFNGAWDHTYQPDTERFNGTNSWSDAPAATASVKFVGSQVRIYGVTDPTHGIVAFSVDGGGEFEVDTYSPDDTAFNRPLFASQTLCAGEHTLVARVTGRKGPLAVGSYVSFDRAEVVP